MEFGERLSVGATLGPILCAALVIIGASVHAQSGAAPYVPPRTPWRDPDLQGSYTNKYEQNTPFERPAEFEGRRIQDFSAAKLSEILKKRQQQALDRAADVGPLEFRDNLEVARGADPSSFSIHPMARSVRS